MAETYDVSFLEARGAEMSVWQAGANLAGQQYCADGAQNNVAEMVQAAQACAPGGTISHLEFVGHGGPGEQELGSRAGMASLFGGADLDRTTVDQLGGLPLSAGAEIDFGGCQVGRGQAGVDFLARASQVTGATTRGGVDNQWPMIPGWEGPVVTCAPPAPASGLVPDCTSSDPSYVVPAISAPPVEETACFDGMY